MKLLITGSSGFLGKNILEYIQEFEVYELNRFSGNYHFELDKSCPNFNDKFDLVIHAAGHAHSINSNKTENNRFHEVNVIGTENLIFGLEKSGIPQKFVFISSVSVYGLDFGSKIDENTFLGAKDSYGISKIESEKIVLDWCKKHNVVCTILRLPLIVGPNAPGNLGAMIKGIKKGYYFNIAGGKAKKSMVLAEDVAKTILRVSEIGGIYNLTDGYNPSFEEFSIFISLQLGKDKPNNIPFWMANLIAKIGDLFGSSAPLNTKKLVKITSELTFDDTKAREKFGWNPKSVLKGFKLNINK